MRQVLTDKCNALCDALQKSDMDRLLKFNKPKGGYFMWITLPKGITSDTLANALKCKSMGKSELEVSFKRGIICLQHLDR